MSDLAATKTCPDCAETVLAAARKCRFCGYRFEPAPKPAARPAGAGGLLALLRGAKPGAMTVHDLLDEWGIPHGQEDAEPTILHGTIDGVFGFIAVTDARLCFVAVADAGKPEPVRDEHFLSDLLRVHTRRHRMRRALFIEWRDSRTIIELDARQLRTLHELLSRRALIQ